MGNLGVPHMIGLTSSDLFKSANDVACNTARSAQNAAASRAWKWLPNSPQQPKPQSQSFVMHTTFTN
eukprot:6473897-Amphidinium_carterae.2